MTVRRTPESPGNREIVQIDGRGARGLTAPAGPLDAGNSGTTMRLMSGILAAHEFQTVMGGDSSSVAPADEARDSPSDRDGGDHRIR